MINLLIVIFNAYTCIYLSVYDTMVADVAMAAALTRSTSATGSAIMSGDALDTGSPAGSAGDRVSTAHTSSPNSSLLYTCS